MDESTLKSIIGCLEKSRSGLDPWLDFWTFLVVVGVALDIIFIVWSHKDETKDWRRGFIRPPDRPSTLKFVLELLGISLVVLGVAGEMVVDARIGSLETKIKMANDERVVLLDRVARTATERAALANERATKSELALAQYKVPIYRIPVIRGVAVPDLRKGYNQKIVIRSDTRIKVPIFSDIPADKTVSWSLFLFQDAMGKSRYTIDFLPEWKLQEPLMPSRVMVFEFITEADGTTLPRSSPLMNQIPFKAKLKK